VPEATSCDERLAGAVNGLATRGFSDVHDYTAGKAE
jgi:hypothetical protein